MFAGLMRPFPWQVWSESMRKTASEAVKQLSLVTPRLSSGLKTLPVWTTGSGRRMMPLCLTPGADISRCSNPSD